MAAPIDTEHELSSSKLGTKQYWDEAYTREYENYQDTQDIGEVWFGEDSVVRLLNWMERSDLVSEENAILDIGCGNAYTLIELAKNDYKDLTGVDYSQKAIELAKALADTQDIPLTLETCDILGDLPSSDSCLSRVYDICLDKGTYDAISLNPEDPTSHRNKYIHNVTKLLKTQSGLLIITSCNWTEEELKHQFDKDFAYLEKIHTPTFQFGGKQGNRETVLVFKKR